MPVKKIIPNGITINPFAMFRIIIKMLTITDKSKCCGCEACAQICPADAITMKADAEGFFYPETDKEKCVNCGLCEKVCPEMQPPARNAFAKTFAAKHNDGGTRMKSTSGGAFSALAEKTLKCGGAVFGAAFNDKWEAEIICAVNAEELDRLRRSKYVQSRIGSSFKIAKKMLEEGRNLLFSGTPCQCAALKNYLGRDYENLILASIICHGVPSPAVWAKFLQETAGAEKIKNINFRDKRFAWDIQFVSIELKDGRTLPGPKGLMKLFSPLLAINRGWLFRRLYKLPYKISSLYERPSCYKCPFKGIPSSADFVMGDLWGVEEIAPHLYDKKGLSLLFACGDKAMEYLQGTSLELHEISEKDAVRHNPYAAKPVEMNIRREEFFRRFGNEPVCGLIRELSGEKSLPVKIICKIINAGKAAANKIFNSKR